MYEYRSSFQYIPSPLITEWLADTSSVPRWLSRLYTTKANIEISHIHSNQIFFVLLLKKKQRKRENRKDNRHRVSAQISFTSRIYQIYFKKAGLQINSYICLSGFIEHLVLYRGCAITHAQCMHFCTLWKGVILSLGFSCSLASFTWFLVAMDVGSYSCIPRSTC